MQDLRDKVSSGVTVDNVKVEKRDGRVVDFDKEKISDAIRKSFVDLGKVVGPQEVTLFDDIATGIFSEVRDRYSKPVRIAEIQQMVEAALIANHLYDVAKNYTQYRFNRDVERSKVTDINEAVSRLINKDPTLVHENANKDSNVYATQRDLLAGAVSKASAFSMLPPAVATAHLKGEIHFHDADYSPFTCETNCSLPNFWNMLDNGFELGNAPMGSPNSIGVAATQITQIIKDIAGDQYGGQTANRLDEHLVKYAEKDYRKFLEDAEDDFPDGYPLDMAEARVKRLKAREPRALHLEDGYFIPESNDYIHKDLQGTLEGYRETFALLRTRKVIYDAMQTMEYQINSNRVSNGQTPFVTVGFGLGISWFAREIQRAIFLNRIRGLGSNHCTAIFPKLVFTIKHGVNSEPDDPNYDLKQLALECASKRMYPDVVFYENIVKITGDFKAPMGCRSFLQKWVNPETGEAETDGRMNLGVVSVNIPRIALESKGDKDKFWKIFNERMDIAHQALQFRIMRCKQATPLNAPTLYQYGAFGRIGTTGNVDTLFRNERATVSLGYIGLAETVAGFYGKDWIKDHSWNEEGRQFALDIVKRMSDLCKQWSKEEGYHYSLYSTPAESLTDRFNRMDREKYGRIPGITDHDFYTNSFHYPVWLQPTPMEKLQYEVDFPYYASGGFINYCEFPCLQSNLKALEAVWDYAHDLGIGYLGTNTPIDRCYVCGFEGDFEPTEEGFKCPECGNTDPSKCNVTKRTCGYLGNPVQRPMVHGRHEEIAHRVKHMSGETGHVTLSDGSDREWFEEAK